MTPSPGCKASGSFVVSVISTLFPSWNIKVTLVALFKAVPEIVRSESAIHSALCPSVSVGVIVGASGLATCVCEISIVEPSGKLITATFVLSSVLPAV